MKKTIILLLLILFAKNSIIVLQDQNQDPPPEEDQPVQDPPVDEQTLDEQLVGDPPIQEPLAEDQPVQDPPVEDTPIQDPFVQDPPAEDQPVQDPPAEDQPLEEQPVEEQPVEEQPVEEQPVDETTLLQDITQDDTAARLAYNAFKQQYTRSFNAEQDSYRFNIFKENFNKINQHNANPFKTYEQGVNHYTDRTQQEYESRFMVDMGTPTIQGKIVTAPSSFNANNIAGVDYRKRFAVSQIRDQGDCGSCWAFSLIASIQSNLFLKKKGTFKSLSQQHLVDCVPVGQDCKGGCKGCWPGVGANYAAENGNAFAKDYPYIEDQGVCNTRVQLTKYLSTKTPYLQMRGVKDTLYYLIAGGPLSVTLDATKWGPYKGGVFNDCPTEGLHHGHAVALVGVQSDGVWIIKESGKKTWGENGYIRLAAGNSCGITDWVVLPVIE